MYMFPMGSYCLVSEAMFGLEPSDSSHPCLGCSVDHHAESHADGCGRIVPHTSSRQPAH